VLYLRRRDRAIRDTPLTADEQRRAEVPAARPGFSPGTTMIVFILVATLLVIAVLAILLPPLWRSPSRSSSADRREANLAIFRDQLGELERDRDAGSLAAADFTQARSELQRRLLEEVEPPSTSPRSAAISPAASSRRTAIALAVVLPLAAAAGYALLGNPSALDPLQRQARVSPEQIEQMLTGWLKSCRKTLTTARAG
jgi:cytochrome c-type biogenesis protein CcmH